MMEVTLTCSECGSGIPVYPSLDAKTAVCDICKKEEEVNFDKNHMKGVLEDCPCCERKDFYIQKDFNRKIGVVLFVIAAIASIWTYGLSLVALWLVDLFLFQKLKPIAICYKCNAIFRNLINFEALNGFDHEMNDRIVYADHDFKGESISH